MATTTASFTKSVGKFSFTAKSGIAIPENIGEVQRDSLPFPELFANAKHNDYFEVPQSFWTSSKDEGGRGRKEAETPLKWQKQKIKDSMNDWRKKDASRANHSVTVIERKIGDEVPGSNGKAKYEEPTIGFWVVINKKDAKPA